MLSFFILEEVAYRILEYSNVFLKYFSKKSNISTIHIKYIGQDAIKNNQFFFGKHLIDKNVKGEN